MVTNGVGKFSSNIYNYVAYVTPVPTEETLPYVPLRAGFVDGHNTNVFTQTRLPSIQPVRK